MPHFFNNSTTEPTELVYSLDGRKPSETKGQLIPVSQMGLTKNSKDETEEQAGARHNNNLVILNAAGAKLKGYEFSMMEASDILHSAISSARRGSPVTQDFVDELIAKSLKERMEESPKALAQFSTPSTNP